MTPSRPRRKPLTKRNASVSELIAALQQVSHSFGSGPAREKLSLLGQLAKAGPPSVRQLIALQGVLDFVRAYPDGREVRAASEAVVRQLRSWIAALSPDKTALTNSGLPGTTMTYSYHFGVLRQLLQAWPGSCEFDWGDLEDEAALIQALDLSLPSAESDGLYGDRLTLRDWLAGCRPRKGASDLETTIGIIAGAGHTEQLESWLFDNGDLPIRYSLRSPGQGRCEVTLPGGRRCYQQQAIERDRYPLRPLIQRALPAVRPCRPNVARALLAIAHAALCSRCLEIYPLIHANDRDVTLVPCGRGIQVVVVGTRPAMRATLESLYFFLVLKNGVPIAYGPAGVFFGACEMGINLFPEFRGSEIRYVYSQVMRALRHVLGADYFFVQDYGMGVGNPDAIASGAFWFYRKLGFVADNPNVEQLAQAEEQRMLAEPGYRSDRRMLHRLKHTRVYLDLSEGRSSWFDFERLGVQLSEFVSQQYGGDRNQAAARCAASVARTLGIRRSGLCKEQISALGGIAPIVAMLPDLDRWTATEKRALGRAIVQKGAASEAAGCRALAKHTRLRQSLLALADARPPTD